MVDVLPQDTSDEVILEYGGREQRVFLTFDRPAEKAALERLAAGQPVARMITCHQKDSQRLSPGDVLE